MVPLPIVLAGPIVRRVDTRSASVWLALSEPAHEVEIRIFDGRQKSTGPGTVAGAAPVGLGAAATLRMGAHLHVVVAVADGSDDPANDGRADPARRFALRAGGIYSYDLVIRRDGQPDVGLLGLGLLQDDPVDPNPAIADPVRSVAGVLPLAPRHLALGYEKGFLPSFVLPAPILSDIRLAQASCRKSHAGGSDALAWLDDLIGAQIDQGDRRIQQLFLTGDQIYADDVPSCLLPMYHDLAMRLMGDGDASGEEELPTRAGAPVGTANVNMQSAPPMRRTVLARSDAGFTSVESQNHLLTVGEYAAAFLTAWSPHAWGALADEARVYGTAYSDSAFTITDLVALFTREGAVKPATPADMAALLQERHGPEFAKERQRVLVYAATIGKVARVLANCATYMIFDDHDVTDDWNLNRRWRNRVYSRAMGRAIVRNALIVYSFFQAWGSDWRSWTKPDLPNGKVLNNAVRFLATPRGRPLVERDALDKLFDFDGGTAPEQRADFHYEVPGSIYQCRVMDSRTRRSDPVALSGAAALLGDSLDLQIPKKPSEIGVRFFLFVASTPVIGPEIFEQMVLPLGMLALDAYRATGLEEDTEPQPRQPGRHGSALGLATSRTDGAAFVDTETWPANPPAQHELLSRLASYGHAVVIGGDVHYGTNLFVDWWEFDRRVGESSRKNGRVVQLTSSAARNVLDQRVETIYRGFHWMNLWAAGNAIEGFGIKKDATGAIKLPDGKRPSLARLGRMREAPAILPAHGWPAGTRLDPEPDWWFSQSQVRDTRPDAARSGPFKVLAAELAGPIAEATAAAGRDRAVKVAAVHQLAASRNFAPLREMVMTNNVGLISFQSRVEGDTARITVIHELLSSVVQGYPEDKVDAELPKKRPLGVTAQVQGGKIHTRVEIRLEPESARPVFNRRPGS